MLAATPASYAFVPQNVAFRRSSFLRSTSEERKLNVDEVVASAIRNGVSSADLDAIIGGKSPITRSIPPPLCSESNIDKELAKVANVETRAALAAYMDRYKGQSGAAIIYSKLQEHGVTVVNGFSGGAVLPLLDQFHVGHPRHATSGKEPIRWITNSNEASAGHIAEGYAKSMPVDPENLPVAVAIATSGPGVTNLITPLQDAICDGVPMVVLCGQAATVAPKDAFQACPAVELTRPCTKWSYQIKSAAELPMVLDYAFYVARNGRPGPVFVDLPKDLQNQVLTGELIDNFVSADNPGNENSFASLKPLRRHSGEIFSSLRLGTDGKNLNFEIARDVNNEYVLKPVTHIESPDLFMADHHPTGTVYFNEFDGDKVATTKDSIDPNSPMMKKMYDMIRKAKKPIILAGQGANDSPEEIKAFAEALRIPVTTTLHAMGVFDERHELALNMLGMHGHPTPNFMIQESDLIISVGSRFDDRITGRMSDFIPEAKKAQEEGRGGVIHVDIRLTENSKQLAPTYFVHSTVKKFLQAMNEIIKTKDIKPMTGHWIEEMKRLQSEYPIKIPHFPTEMVETPDKDGNMQTVPRTRMSAQSVVQELNRQLCETGKIDDAIFTTGVGVHQMVAAQLITWTQPRQMLSSGSLGTMGVALGYSIGAKLANGKKIVIAVDGDGSFNMTFTELKTLAEEKIPVKIMILDNDGQMMVEYWQRLFHDNRLLAVRNTANPDYTKLAEAFGIKSLYCDAQEDLQDVMRQFLFDDPEEPVVFHVRIERTPCLPLVAPGQPLQDMILEDVDVDVDGAAAPS